MQRFATMLVLAAVMVAGCGSRVSIPTQPPAPSSNPMPTISQPDDVAADVEPTETSTTQTPVLDGVSDIGDDEIDVLLADVDATLAELDQLLIDAAAALAAEEGEIIP